METTDNKTEKSVSTSLRVENATPKRKERLTIEWPKGKFTIKEIIDQYPNHPAITVRHRIRRMEDTGQAVTVGYTFGDLGRPQKYLILTDNIADFEKANPNWKEQLPKEDLL
jgi:hypothetical protein